jgi:cytochrome c553
MVTARFLTAMTLGTVLFGAGQAWAQKATAVTPATADFQATVWAASCMACHGTDGKADGSGLSLAGRPAQELYRMMLAFKGGHLKATIMHQLSKGYSDEELKRITEYFSKLI